MRGANAGSQVRTWIIAPLRNFMRAEVAGGVILLAAAATALVWANSPLKDAYDALWQAEIPLRIGRFGMTETLRHWVNDGLMTVFFFVVGLEVKRALAVGELRDPRAAALPVVAALGGMLVPAAIYASLNAGGPGSAGWGIPMATDIAFAVGVLAVLGRRVPSGLKVFVLTLAIVDDIGAIVVIAAFYSSGIAWGWLATALCVIGAVVVMRVTGVSHPILYVPIGAVAWLATLQAGVHPTIAGVAIALITPAQPVAGRPVLLDLERRLLPVSSYFIVPVFALANAGVALNPARFGDALSSPIFWGIPLALLFGKTVGVTLATFGSVRLRIARLPTGVGWRHVVGAGALAGIGFTVSLLIASLTFRGSPLGDLAKLGILTGSAASALVGAVLLRSVPAAPPQLPAQPFAPAPARRRRRRRFERSTRA